MLKSVTNEQREHCVSLTKTIAVYSGNFKKSVIVIYRQSFKVLNVGSKVDRVNNKQLSFLKLGDHLTKMYRALCLRACPPQQYSLDSYTNSHENLQSDRLM